MHPKSLQQHRARLSRVAAAAGMAMGLALSGALTTTAVSLDVPTGLGQIVAAYGPTASVARAAKRSSCTAAAKAVRPSSIS